MTSRSWISWTAAAAISAASLAAPAPAFAGAAMAFDPATMIPIDQVQTGMKGVARTVFEGRKVEEFPVEVVGVIRHSSSDGDLILVHCLGERLEHSGIAAGMSGSPVYFGGRLAGAIALGWPFSKDAVGGVTPIEQMLRITEVGDSARTRELEPAAPRGTDRMSPLPLLLGLSGHSAHLEALADSLAPEWSHGALMGSSASMGDAVDGGSGADLVPGAAVGVSLVRGDLSVSAVGTVTCRQGDRIVCFGHPLFSIGSVSLPLSAAYVHTILSSQLSSFKVASLGTVVGELTEDRAYAIRGVVGARADEIPVTLHLADEDGAARTYRYFVARHHALSANLTGLAVADALSSAAGGISHMSLPYSARLSFAGGRVLAWEDEPATVPGGSPPLDVARDVAFRMNLLANNPWREERLDSLEIDARIQPGSRWMAVEGAWMETGRARRGSRLPLAVKLRRDRGESHVEHLAIDLPAHLPPGRYRIVVGDMDSRSDAERLRAPGLFRLQGLDQALDLLALRGSRAGLYAALYSDDLSASSSGRELPALPGGALAALDESRQSGAIQWVKARRWTEVSRKLPWTVTGSADITLNIESEAP